MCGGVPGAAWQGRLRGVPGEQQRIKANDAVRVWQAHGKLVGVQVQAEGVAKALKKNGFKPSKGRGCQHVESVPARATWRDLGLGRGASLALL